MKTAELTGADLDYWVAKAEGYELDAGGYNRTIRENGGAPSEWNPSTDWAQGGPIIERERLHLAPALPRSRLRWDCFTTPPVFKHERWFNGSGDTPLIAAMRCFVASKFGDETT